MGRCRPGWSVEWRLGVEGEGAEKGKGRDGRTEHNSHSSTKSCPWLIFFKNGAVHSIISLPHLPLRTACFPVSSANACSFLASLHVECMCVCVCVCVCISKCGRAVYSVAEKSLKVEGMNNGRKTMATLSSPRMKIPLDGLKISNVSHILINLFQRWGQSVLEMWRRDEKKGVACVCTWACGQNFRQTSGLC